MLKKWLIWTPLLEWGLHQRPHGWMSIIKMGNKSSWSMAEIKSGTSVLCFVCSYLFRVRAHCKILFHDKELLPGNPAATDFCCVCVRGFIPSAHRIDVAPTRPQCLSHSMASYFGGGHHL
jgi:hypothetical protein